MLHLRVVHRGENGGGSQLRGPSCLCFPIGGGSHFLVMSSGLNCTQEAVTDGLQGGVPSGTLSEGATRCRRRTDQEGKDKSLRQFNIAYADFYPNTYKI